jgi:NTE family protein
LFLLGQGNMQRRDHGIPLLNSSARICRRAFALLLVQACILTVFVRAQDSDTKTERTKVGLVLEGGGALGLAHIGVLKWFEEHHIPVTYIAGTSMGGLVSGVYATGHTPAETLALIQGINWDQVLSGQIPFEDMSFRRKEDAVEFPTGLEFGLRHGFQLPAGFNSGQQVNFILDRVALPYSGVKNFNELPTPFACVATDLVTGKPHVFRDGPLSLALRSTMSLPGIFAPVHYEGHIYADGGLTNNLPVDVAIDMGANYTVAVFLQTAPLNPNTDLSVLGVAGQSIGLMIAANETEHKKMANILINVDLDKYSAMDYNKSEEIVEQGYKAAEANKEGLLKLAVDDASWQEYLANRQRKRLTVPVPKFVEVTGTSEMLDTEISKKLDDNVDHPVDPTQLETGITQILGAGRFSSLSYRMTEKNGEPGLLITATEKSYAPPIIRPLIVVNGAQYNNVLFSAGARITFLDFGSYGAEWRNDIIVGSVYQIASEYYRPFNPKTKWFVAPRVLFNSSLFYIYDNQDLVAEYRQRQLGGGADIGYAIDSAQEIRFGYATAYEKYSTQIGYDAEFPRVSGRAGETHVHYTLDGTNDPVLPTKGAAATFRGEWWDSNPAAQEAFPLTQLTARYFKPISPRSSLFVGFSGGTTFGYRDTGIPAFSLGGPAMLAAYGQNQFLTDQYYYFEAGYIRQLFKLPPLFGDNLSFVGYYEVAKPFYRNNPADPTLPMDGVAALVLKTILGPIEVAGAFGSTQSKVFFQISRVF